MLLGLMKHSAFAHDILFSGPSDGLVVFSDFAGVFSSPAGRFAFWLGFSATCTTGKQSYGTEHCFSYPRMWLSDSRTEVIGFSNSDVALEKLPRLSINLGTVRGPDVRDEEVLA